MNLLHRPGRGHSSDCVLRPVLTCPDPIRGGDDDILVQREVLDTDIAPHPSHTRAAPAGVAERCAAQEPVFGIEQEYTIFDGAIVTACESLGEGSRPLDHVKNYGAGIDQGLTGLHGTAPWDEFS